MTLLGFGRGHLREVAVTHQCNGGRRFSLRMKPHQPNGEVRGRRGASTVTGMVQDDESCRCTCRASFFSTSAPVSSSHRIARNPSFRARTAGLRRTRRLTLITNTSMQPDLHAMSQQQQRRLSSFCARERRSPSCPPSSLCSSLRWPL